MGGVAFRHPVAHAHAHVRLVESNTQKGIFYAASYHGLIYNLKTLGSVENVHSVYSLSLPYYMVSVSIGSAPNSVCVTTVRFDADSGHNIAHCSALLLALQHEVLPDY